mmetsp:Transcript_12599/g.36606  ORF Transcript_12599/g.36606 Transcript_12599/m.36606 type:complete len:297 (+) Transcript_12599:284-1174(+)
MAARTSGCTSMPYKDITLSRVLFLLSASLRTMPMSASSNASKSVTLSPINTLSLPSRPFSSRSLRKARSLSTAPVMWLEISPVALWSSSRNEKELHVMGRERGAPQASWRMVWIMSCDQLTEMMLAGTSWERRPLRTSPHASLTCHFCRSDVLTIRRTSSLVNPWRSLASDTSATAAFSNSPSPPRNASSPFIPSRTFPSSSSPTFLRYLSKNASSIARHLWRTWSGSLCTSAATSCRSGVVSLWVQVPSKSMATKERTPLWARPGWREGDAEGAQEGGGSACASKKPYSRSMAFP